MLIQKSIRTAIHAGMNASTGNDMVYVSAVIILNSLKRKSTTACGVVSKMFCSSARSNATDSAGDEPHCWS